MIETEDKHYHTTNNYYNIDREDSYANFSISITKEEAAATEEV